jgi:rod shape-determining protein MreD
MSARVLTPQSTSAGQAGAAWLPGSLLWRVAILSVAVVFVQISVISEVPVFGVSVDLSPLLVAFTGLLCGSMLGAIAGFAVGLLIDLALMQTLGVTSLTFTLIGYWSGRLRELRDPQAALTPLLVGAAAAAAAMVGYSLIEFLLGVDAPVSFELLREIVVGVLVDTAVALPMWALVRRCLIGGLPEDPRRRRRRAYTTGGLSPLSHSPGRGRNPLRGGSRSSSGGASTLGPLTRASERER